MFKGHYATFALSWICSGGILTFGLHIGVNLAVLSVVDRMMFRPLPYGKADSLVHPYNMQSTGGPSPSAYLPRMVTEALQGRPGAPSQR